MRTKRFSPVEIGGLTLKTVLFLKTDPLGLRGEELSRKIQLSQRAVSQIIIGDVPVRTEIFSLSGKKDLPITRLCELDSCWRQSGVRLISRTAM